MSNAYSIGGLRLPKNESVVLDDGLFEVDLIKKPVSLSDLADGFQGFFAQSQGVAGARVHVQAAHLVFTSEEPIPWTIDGEYGGCEAVNVVENCTRALDNIRGK